MRVIAGTARGIRLQAVPGTTTRPISDRVKEALFSILGESLVGARFLDLFAGTGSVGIEALSRGASEAVFVDSEARALTTIRVNLAHTRLEAGARLVHSDAFKYLGRTPGPFDFVYVAPPQYRALWSRTLQAIDANPSCLDPCGQVIVQVFPKEFEPTHLASLALADQRRYGSTLLCFFLPTPRPGE
jgi:16S rRNA (guanine(966)-N(2))-methyltransferase RsmD